jgi:hypothetical protein
VYLIKQNVEVASDCDKYPSLVHHLREFNDGSKVMVFVETKKGCDQLTRSLCFQGYPVLKLLCVLRLACSLLQVNWTVMIQFVSRINSSITDELIGSSPKKKSGES